MQSKLLRSLYPGMHSACNKMRSEGAEFRVQDSQNLFIGVLCDPVYIYFVLIILFNSRFLGDFLVTYRYIFLQYDSNEAEILGVSTEDLLSSSGNNNIYWRTLNIVLQGYSQFVGILTPPLTLDRVVQS